MNNFPPRSVCTKLFWKCECGNSIKGRTMCVTRWNLDVPLTWKRDVRWSLISVMQQHYTRDVRSHSRMHCRNPRVCHNYSPCPQRSCFHFLQRRQSSHHHHHHPHNPSPHVVHSCQVSLFRASRLPATKQAVCDPSHEMVTIPREMLDVLFQLRSPLLL